MADQAKDKWAHSKAKPTKMSASQLCTKGPGNNWHIILTDYDLLEAEVRKRQLQAIIVPRGKKAVVGKKIELLKNGVSVEEAEAFVRKRANFEGYYREAAGQYFFDAEEGPPVDNAGAYYTWAAGLAVAGVGAFAAKAMRR